MTCITLLHNTDIRIKRQTHELQACYHWPSPHTRSHPRCEVWLTKTSSNSSRLPGNFTFCGEFKHSSTVWFRGTFSLPCCNSTPSAALCSCHCYCRLDARLSLSIALSAPVSDPHYNYPLHHRFMHSASSHFKVTQLCNPHSKPQSLSLNWRSIGPFLNNKSTFPDGLISKSLMAGDWHQLGQADSWAETGWCHQVEDGAAPVPGSCAHPGQRASCDWDTAGAGRHTRWDTGAQSRARGRHVEDDLITPTCIICQFISL